MDDKKYLQNLTPKSKYDLIIGFIEGCMPNDKDVVATEQVLDSLLEGLGITFEERKEIKWNEICWYDAYCIKGPLRTLEKCKGCKYSLLKEE